MGKNLFLVDSWVLNTYSLSPAKERLRVFLSEGGFLPVINSLNLVEVFNPGWMHAPSRERGRRIADLLADLAVAIVDPRSVVIAEFKAYPELVSVPPLEIELSKFPASIRRDVLLKFLRADPVFLELGKDIRRWAEAYKELKLVWDRDRGEVLSEAVRMGQLSVHPAGFRFASSEARDDFLCSLDLRLLAWLSSRQRRGLGEHLVSLFLGGSKNLRAVRLSSLLFTYSYVELPAGEHHRASPSDVGDHWHLMLAPYCAAITLDSAMERVLERLRSEAGLDCIAYSPANLKAAMPEGAA